MNKPPSKVHPRFLPLTEQSVLQSIRPALVLTMMLAFVVSVSGCDLLGLSNDDLPSVPASVYVINQGNFGDGNGSVTVYNPEKDTTSGTMATNLGTILQSGTIVNNRLYLMSNSTNRIDIFSTEDQNQVGQVSSVRSPRYMIPVSPGKAYITNLYKSNFSGGTVTVLDLSSQTVTKTVDVGNNPEGLLVLNDRAYVANHAFGAGHTLSVLDTDADSVVNTIELGCDGPRKMALDEQEEILVFCTGQTRYNADFTEVVEKTNGAILVLNPETEEVIKTVTLDHQISTVGPGQDMFYSPQVQEAYVALANNTVLRFNTENNSKASVIGVPGEGKIGAVAYQAGSAHLYVGQAPANAPFTQRGTVKLLDRSGQVQSSFRAGIAPSHFVFK